MLTIRRPRWLLAVSSYRVFAVLFNKALGGPAVPTAMVPCNHCSAQILEDTADKTGGLCMPAKVRLFQRESFSLGIATRGAVLIANEQNCVDDVDREFWKEPDGLQERLTALARAHRLVDEN